MGGVPKGILRAWERGIRAARVLRKVELSDGAYGDNPYLCSKSSRGQWQLVAARGRMGMQMRNADPQKFLSKILITVFPGRRKTERSLDMSRDESNHRMIVIQSEIQTTNYPEII